MSLRLAVYGFGEIGRILARVALNRGHKMVWSHRHEPALVGKDIGEILGIGKLFGDLEE